MPQLIPSSTTLPAIEPVQAAATRTVVWGVAPLFDYGARQFVFDDSNDLVLGNEATTLSQRITSCLVTPRTRWPIYSPWFGCDFWTIWGRNYSPELVKSMAEQFVKWAVRDDRIVKISGFNTSVIGKSVTVQFQTTNLAGFKQQFEGKWSV